MRTRLVLAGAVMGAALLTGATLSTAHAAPVPTVTDTTTVVSTADWQYPGQTCGRPRPDRPG
ncbi:MULTISPECIES: hypothetical protein [unclassified Streptomyces]|uniref:hypothetical protein n=1 Tax=unclassified Streptomyces TaxID=2593676 RepID=UPI002F9164B3